MKQLFRFWIVAALLFFAGCVKEYDDSALAGRVDDLESRITRLEQLCQQINTNISSLQTIVTALQNNDYVTGVTPLTENDKTIGYTITFAKAQAITIYHGKDGANGTNGKDGHSPIVGVRQDKDGIYYWTLDGEWLTDGNGNKIPVIGYDGQDVANGADGITPQLKIENGYWYISYDNGLAWTQLGKAIDEDEQDSDSFFHSVTQDENNVYFTLADGSVITIPKGQALSIIFDEADLVVMSPNTMRQISYIVTSATEPVTVEVTSSADIKAKVIEESRDGLTGKIEVRTGDSIDEYSKVIVFVSNGDKVIMRSIAFEEAGLHVEENSVKNASAEGGELTLEFLSNVECKAVISEDAQDWISIMPETKALERHSITLMLNPNEGAARSAEILVKSSDNKLYLTYTISQNANTDYQLALEHEALIAIYNVLDGDNWTNNENWCSDKPVCEWSGIQVNEYGNVIELSIEGNVTINSRRAMIPREIQNLKHLQSLNLQETNIDSFPEEMSCLNIENFYLRDNIFILLTDITPIINKNLKFFYVLNNFDVYFSSDAYQNPTPIPDELLNKKNLEALMLTGCNLSGEIPDKLWELSNLKDLELSNMWETYLTGEIPSTIANLKNLSSLRLFNLNLSGGIPDELYNLTNLEHLSIDGCYIGGALSPDIKNLKNLRFLNLRDANLTGELPETLADIMDAELLNCMLSSNNLTGDIPHKIKAHPKWAQFWTSIISNNQFNLTLDDIPAPVFDLNDVYGNRLVSEQIYAKNKLTIIYGFDIMFPYNSNLIYNCADMHLLYNTYNKHGVDLIMCDGSGYSGSGTKSDAIKKFLQDNNLPWSAINADPVGMTDLPYVIIVDSNKKVVYTTILTNSCFSDIVSFFEEKFPNDQYTSSDYSQNGKVTTLQTATQGNGIDIVLMGDAYSDRQIADGTYKSDMDNIYNNLFTEEPYKSLKNCFNVYYVNVVSATEGYEYGHTALDGFFGDGTNVGGNDATCFEYALKAISEERMDEALVIVAMNSDNYAGTCYMYYPTYTTGTYGSGTSIAYFPRGGDQTTFSQLLHHEACGHGFAKLADEYAYEHMGAIPETDTAQTQTQQTDWGWWKNVDFTNDPSAVRWNRFINDSRYANDGLGAFEGALTYWTGVWRPTENSIMRHNTGGFNAPSREAIYYRIHKLAYGDSWQYDYEDFVEWDARNHQTAATRATADKPANYKPTHPPVIVKKSWKDAK